MDKERDIRIAITKLESRKTHRIDLLRAMSGMERHEFDTAIKELARARRLELVGGDTSGMTDEQIEDLIKVDGDIFVNVVWMKSLPSKARGRISPDGREGITVRLPHEMVGRLRASGRADGIVEEALIQAGMGAKKIGSLNL